MSVQISLNGQPAKTLGYDAVNYRKVWVKLADEFEMKPSVENKLTLKFLDNIMLNFIETGLYNVRHHLSPAVLPGYFKFRLNGQIYSPTQDGSLGKWQDPWFASVPRDPQGGTHLFVKWDGPPVQGKTSLELSWLWFGSASIFARSLELIIVGATK